MPIANVRLVVLDLAGTTVAVSDDVPQALREAFRQEGLSLQETAILGIRGRSKKEAVRELVDKLAPESRDPQGLTERIFARFRVALKERYSEGATAIPEAAETMRWLRTHGVAVILTTGFDRDLAVGILDQLGWESNLVDAVVSADDVRHGRPEPDLVLRAMDIANVTDPSEVVVLGDTCADLQAASRAGVAQAVGVLTGAHTREQLAGQPHSAILNSIADLPSWLQEVPA